VAVAALSAEYCARPNECVAYWGPSIGPCCYPVGEEVVESIRATGAGPDTEGWLTGGRNDRRVDLRGALTRQAVSAGLLRASVVSSPACTCCDRERFDSYRRDGANSGRMVFFAGFPG
jgi:copper oxidase (laccase) domain-containing protein